MGRVRVFYCLLHINSQHIKVASKNYPYIFILWK
jgi:hypothetical protein